MLKFVIRRNCLHPATGDIDTTFETFKVFVPVIESALDRKWGGIKDASVVECRILKEDMEASTQHTTQGKTPKTSPDGEIAAHLTKLESYEYRSLRDENFIKTWLSDMRQLLLT